MISVPTAIGLYFILWWLVLFAVLPWGVEREERPESGNDPGAPKRHGLLLKFAVTTVLTFIPFSIIYWAVNISDVTFDDLNWMKWFG